MKLIPILFLALATALFGAIPQPRHAILTVSVESKVAAMDKAQEIAAAIPGSRVMGFVWATGSMMPFLDEGCVLVYRKVPFAELEKGDVALGDWQHRIIDGNARDGFQTEGDNNPGPDREALTAKNYRGEVVAAVIRFAVIPWHRPTSLVILLHQMAKNK